MTTALHWFGENKSRAVDAIVDILVDRNPFDIASFHDILRAAEHLDEGRVIEVYPPFKPDALDSEIMLPEQDGLDDWDWWNLVKDSEVKQQKFWPFLDRVKEQRDFLLYAQREYICKRFPDYDPARQDMWEQHDRPWDYDHILATAETSRHYVPTAIRRWASCIANQRAWPMERNRSDQRASPKTKLRDQHDRRDSFITDDEIDRFSEASQDIHNASAGSAFIHAAKARLIRMYQEWYETLEIADLVGDDDTAAEVHGDTDR